MFGVHSGTALRIEAFDYPASSRPLPVLWDELVDVGGASRDSNNDENAGSAFSDTLSGKSSTAATSEQAGRSFDAGREQGIREGRETESKAQRELVREAESKGARQAAHLASQFAVERDQFLETVEHEVVRLALAIAARILRREAQADPLFLVGAVRVALGQLAATLEVRLRVPVSDASLWAETLAHIPNLRVKPTVVPDESMHGEECAIETDMGSVDLGLPAQLRQMEYSLFDEAPPKQREIEANRNTAQS
jgi:flagellar assembly protein FliH